MSESRPRDSALDRSQDHVTLGQIIDEFVFSCPSQLYRQAISQPTVRRCLVNYVLQRLQWELPPELLRVEDTQRSVAEHEGAFREYVECAIYWGMEEIIRDRLDLSWQDKGYSSLP